MTQSVLFSTDHYFHIGYPHLTGGKPCQDYAISGVHGGIAYAIVSDGCSTGGHTDVGSRLVALSTAAAIKKFATILPNDRLTQDVEVRQSAVLAGTQELLGLAVPDLYATCVYACVSEEGGYIALRGDGLVVLKYRDGKSEITRYDWEGNTPYYPVYASACADKAFLSAHGNDPNGLRLKEERWVYEQDGERRLVETKQISVRDGMNGILLKIPKEKILDELAFIGVFSDGITQIDGVDCIDAVNEFLAFTNIRGEFVKRRMINAVKSIQKSGHQLLDDVFFQSVEFEIPCL
jgi:hypothetical protein